MAREDSFFDDLARGLADGSVTRGKALRLMGAALVGGTLASFPGVAWAAKGGGGIKSSCAHFCQSLFGSSTPQEAECVSQGTKGQGPCFTCTTQTGCGPNFTKPTCTVTGQTYSCSTCQCGCPSGQEVCGGSCVSTSCPTGQVFDPSSCACVAQCLPILSDCYTDTQCCSGICESAVCSHCRCPTRACTSASECCSGICSGGTCGYALTEYSCPCGSQLLLLCSSTPCNNGASVASVCSSACPGGYTGGGACVDNSCDVCSPV